MFGLVCFLIAVANTVISCNILEKWQSDWNERQMTCDELNKMAFCTNKKGFK